MTVFLNFSFIVIFQANLKFSGGEVCHIMKCLQTNNPSAENVCVNGTKETIIRADGNEGYLLGKNKTDSSIVAVKNKTCKYSFWGYFIANIGSRLIFPIENSIFFSQSTGKKFPVKVTKLKNWIKISKMFETYTTSLIQCWNDYTCHPRQWLIVFI